MHIGAAESVDCLLRIADEDQALVAEERRLQHRPLRGVGVLELVDEHGVVAFADALRDRTRRPAFSLYPFGQARQHRVEREHAAALDLRFEAWAHGDREVRERREPAPERDRLLDEGVECLDQRPKILPLKFVLVAAFGQLALEGGLQGCRAQVFESSLSSIFRRQDRAFRDPHADLIATTREMIAVVEARGHRDQRLQLLPVRSVRKHRLHRCTHGPERLHARTGLCARIIATRWHNLRLDRTAHHAGDTQQFVARVSAGLIERDLVGIGTVEEAREFVVDDLFEDLRRVGEQLEIGVLP